MNIHVSLKLPGKYIKIKIRLEDAYNLTIAVPFSAGTVNLLY